MAKQFYVSRTVFNYEIEGAVVKIKDGQPYFDEKQTVSFALPALAEDKVLLAIFSEMTGLKNAIITSKKETAKTHRIKFEDFVKYSEVFERPKSQTRREK